MLDSVCPFCAGHVDRDLTSRVHEQGACIGVIEQLDRYQEYFVRDHPVIVSVDCERCSFYSFIPVGVVLLTRPSVTGQLHGASIDVRGIPLWDLGFVVDPDAVTVQETDPMSVEVTIPDADESLVFTIDDSFNIIDRSDH